MKLEITLLKENILTLMRRCGYAPEGQDEKTGELRWTRPLMGRRYPRFHVYSTVSVSPDSAKAVLNLHLDQKQPSYQGTAAHSGEYDGPVVEAEARRIQHVIENMV